MVKGGSRMVKDSEIDLEGRSTLRYRLCPCCTRAVPATSSERYCINDGTWMLEGCPLCSTAITSPYTCFCATCGLEFATLETTRERS
jgi:hypothetical protein